MAEEGLRKTKNELIHIGSPIPFDADTFLSQLGPLMEAAYGNRENIRESVESMVSTYHPAGRNGQARKDAVFEKLAMEAVAANAGE